MSFATLHSIHKFTKSEIESMDENVSQKLPVKFSSPYLQQLVKSVFKHVLIL